MKKFIFLIFAFVIAFAVSSCVSFPSENKIGIGFESEGMSFFCLYDQKAGESFSQQSTCSFRAKKDNIIYECSELKLSNIGKDFKLETDCKIIIDLNKQSTEVKVNTDFKTSQKSSRLKRSSTAVIRHKLEKEQFRLYGRDNQPTYRNNAKSLYNNFIADKDHYFIWS